MASGGQFVVSPDSGLSGFMGPFSTNGHARDVKSPDGVIA